MTEKIKQYWNSPVGKAAVAVVTALLLTIGVVIVVEDTNDDGSPDKITITVNQKSDRAPSVHPSETELEVPAPVLAEVARDEIHEDARDETPPQVSPQEAQKINNTIEKQIAVDPLPLSFPLAATSYTGCRARFVGNQSSRNGARPRQVWMHYTVSPNRPGRSDVDSITALFNNLGFQASSNFVVDRDGNCNYIVPTYRKAWTQAAANPIAISFEIINTGSEKPFMKNAGYRQVSRTIARLSTQYGIPLQLGSHGCTGARKGIVYHKMGGLCAGGHHDIRPFNLKRLIQAAKCWKQKPPKRGRCLRRVL